MSARAQEAVESTYVESVLDTAEAEVPERPAQAHEGEITGVQIFESDGGAVAIQIDLTSLNTAQEDNFKAFVPEMFIEDVNVSPSSLPEEEGNNQRFSYRQNISNSDKDAVLQVLRQLAFSQGRGAVLEGTEKPTDFESFVEMHAKLLPGTKLIYRKRETVNNKTNQKFYGVTNYFSSPEDANNPRKFKKYKKMWDLE